MPQKLALLVLLFLTGCGYRWGDGGAIPCSYRTVSIPYIEGDMDGQLTAALIQQISESGVLAYQESCGALTLNIEVIDLEDENIGFRYDRKKDGCFTSAIIPDETRLTIIVELTGVETCSGNVIMGPVRIKADVEFDHDYYSSRNAVNVFSLGQLTDYDEAYDAAQTPLSQRLARKIVDYVRDNW